MRHIKLTTTLLLLFVFVESYNRAGNLVHWTPLKNSKYYISYQFHKSFPAKRNFATRTLNSMNGSISTLSVFISFDQCSSVAGFSLPSTPPAPGTGSPSGRAG